MTVSASLQQMLSSPKTILLTLLALSWPMAVVALTPHAGAWLPLVIMALLVWWRLSRERRHWGLVLMFVAAMLALSGHASIGIRAWPILVNASLLGMFAWTLRCPPSLIERLARRQEPDLSEHGVRYTRRVTQVWCLFFAGNGLISLWTALYADLATWAVYNGGIAYGLCALLFVIEWCVRQRVREKSSDAFSRKDDGYHD